MSNVIGINGESIMNDTSNETLQGQQESTEQRLKEQSAPIPYDASSVQAVQELAAGIHASISTAVNAGVSYNAIHSVLAMLTHQFMSMMVHQSIMADQQAAAEAASATKQ